MDRENKVLQGYRCRARIAIEFSECPKKGASALPGDQDMKIAKTRKVSSNKGFLNWTLRNVSICQADHPQHKQQREQRHGGKCISLVFGGNNNNSPLAEGWWRNRDQDENWKWSTGQ